MTIPEDAVERACEILYVYGVTRDAEKARIIARDLLAAAFPSLADRSARVVPFYPTDAISDGFFSCDATQGTDGLEEFHYWEGDFGNFVASWQAALAAAKEDK